MQNACVSVDSGPCWLETDFFYGMHIHCSEVNERMFVGIFSAQYKFVLALFNILTMDCFLIFQEKLPLCQLKW